MLNEIIIITISFSSNKKDHNLDDMKFPIRVGCTLPEGMGYGIDHLSWGIIKKYSLQDQVQFEYYGDTPERNIHGVSENEIRHFLSLFRKETKEMRFDEEFNSVCEKFDWKNKTFDDFKRSLSLKEIPHDQE